MASYLLCSLRKKSVPYGNLDVQAFSEPQILCRKVEYLKIPAEAQTEEHLEEQGSIRPQEHTVCNHYIGYNMVYVYSTKASASSKFMLETWTRILL